MNKKLLTILVNMFKEDIDDTVLLTENKTNPEETSEEKQLEEEFLDNIKANFVKSHAINIEKQKCNSLNSSYIIVNSKINHSVVGIILV